MYMAERSDGWNMLEMVKRMVQNNFVLNCDRSQSVMSGAEFKEFKARSTLERHLDPSKHYIVIVNTLSEGVCAWIL